MSVIGFVEESFVSIPQEVAQPQVLPHPLLKTHTDIDIILLVTPLDVVTLSTFLLICTTEVYSGTVTSE